MSVAYDPEVLTRGVVTVHYAMDTETPRGSVNSKLRASLPVFIAGIHLCTNNEAEFKAAMKAIKNMPKSTLVRHRSHFGK